jgi:hypothetical protein
LRESQRTIEEKEKELKAAAERMAHQEEAIAALQAQLAEMREEREV